MSENTIGNLAPEIKQQLAALTAQINSNKVNDTVQRALKEVIRSLIVENITLKRENAKLKAGQVSKS